MSKQGKKLWRKRLIILSVLALVLIVSAELVGRTLGIHQYPRYVASDLYEYVYAAHQNTEIYGNRVRTNSHHMRSDDVNAADSVTKVLVIGDSVVNGGMKTDHDSLATTQLGDQLSKTLKRPVQVLNISAGSWGPDNATAFIQEQGHFGAKAAILVVSSHDWSDHMTFRPIVGINPDLPDRNPSFALGKLWERAVFKFSKEAIAKRPYTLKANQQLTPARDQNSGFDALVNYCQSNQIELSFMLHVTRAEIAQGAYFEGGKNIKDYCQKNGISVFSELDSPAPSAAYRDEIHYSESGQRYLAQSLFGLFVELLRDEN